MIFQKWKDIAVGSLYGQQMYNVRPLNDVTSMSQQREVDTMLWRHINVAATWGR